MNYDDGSEEAVSGNSVRGTGPPAKPTGASASVSSESGKTDFRCPICDRNFVRSESPVMPFCSKRCQQVDMGRWLNESYGLPYEGESSAEGFGSDEDDEDVI